MNVLSLFDGMSCGQIALKQAGIYVNKYFASEIDSAAIKVTRANFPKTIHLGDVTNVSADKLPQIDLLIGGSPCQGFSTFGNMENFSDPRSMLFWQYARLLKELKPRYFLLENVKMKQEWRDVISNTLGVKPISICSSEFTGGMRQRLYWTNIPVNKWVRKNLNVNDYLVKTDNLPNSDAWHKWFNKAKEKQVSKGYTRIVNDHTKAICQTARQFASWNGNIVRLPDDKYRFLNVSECERLQGVPIGYTASATKAEAYKMLGNGWTVDVVAHIFKGILNHDLFGPYEGKLL